MQMVSATNTNKLKQIQEKKIKWKARCLIGMLSVECGANVFDRIDFEVFSIFNCDSSLKWAQQNEKLFFVVAFF